MASDDKKVAKKKNVKKVPLVYINGEKVKIHMNIKTINVY